MREREGTAPRAAVRPGSALAIAMVVGCAEPPPPAPVEAAPTAHVASSPTPARRTAVPTATVPPPVHVVTRVPAEPSDGQGTDCGGPTFWIDQLTLVGILRTENGERRAMLEAPGEVPLAVRVGTMLGRDYGRVREITDTCVRGQRGYRDGSGREVVDSFELCLDE